MSTDVPNDRKLAAVTDEKSLFARWERRKRLVAEEKKAAPEKTEPQPRDAAVEPASPEEEAEVLARLQLPVPESMKAGDDFSVFMQAGVPEFLRRRALRALWRSNPVLANVDHLNDYDDDFRSPELTKEVLATAYQIGRGILRDPDDSETAKEVSDEQRDQSDEAETPEEESVELERTARRPQDTIDVSDSVLETSETVVFRPQRMRFTT